MNKIKQTRRTSYRSSLHLNVASSLYNSITNKDKNDVDEERDNKRLTENVVNMKALFVVMNTT